MRITRTQAAIARHIRKDVGADLVLISSKPVGRVSQDEYAAAWSRSQIAMQKARYLAQVLANMDSAAFLNACGVRA